MDDDQQTVPADVLNSMDAARLPATDRLSVVAIVIGCLGLVFAGVVLAIVTAVLAAIAGTRARESGRSLDNVYIAFTLAIVDGILWLVLHMFLDIGVLWG